MWLQWIFQCVIFLIIFITSRIFRLRLQNRVNETPGLGGRKTPASTMMILGSGGHTAEMIEIAKELDFKKYLPRYYVFAETDITSEVKIQALEKCPGRYKKNPIYSCFKVPRSRDVKQSYITSIFSTLYSILCSIPIVLRTRPELILCNGPGTCIPLCFIAFLLKIFFINRNCKIVFIESYCRVKTLSLSGKILRYFTDIFVVQWPALQKQSTAFKYFGRLT